MTDQPRPIPAALLVPPEALALDRALMSDGAEHPTITDAKIETIPAAAWAVARIAEAREGIDQIHTMAANWRAEINRWESASTEFPKRVIEFLTPKVEQFGLAMRERSPRDHKGEPTVKTVRLPNGEIRTRSPGRGQAAITDDRALLAWLESNLPDAVKVEKKPILAVLMANTTVRFEKGAVLGRLVTKHGELVPGVMVDPGQTSATVVPS
jgi:hypothetical protein